MPPVLLLFLLFTVPVTAHTRLAAVGDFGSEAHGGLVALNEATGAAIVQSLHQQWQLNGVLALGDTNYPCEGVRLGLINPACLCVVLDTNYLFVVKNLLNLPACATARLSCVVSVPAVVVVGHVITGIGGRSLTPHPHAQWPPIPQLTSCPPYAAGGADTIDQNVGKHYGSFMWPLASNYSSGAPDHVNRFFPCPGNHDWGNRGRGNLDAYLEYMPVGGRRTYDVVLDDVHLFALSSDSNEDK